jgi:3-isopropylmalate dehydrogenase
MNKKIIVLAGDGIGKEVTQWGVNVLKAISKRFGHTFTFENALIGHSAIEVEGTPISDATIELCKQSDAVLLGAVGHPMYDNDPSAKVRPEQGLLKIRKELGLYTNIRPIKVFDELIGASSIKPEVLRGADFLFYRELTGGIYFGEPRERFNNGDSARDTKVYHKYEVERIARKAFESARTRRKILHSVDKANVLESSRLWREVIQALSPEYPDVTVNHIFVDNAAMQLIRDPLQFDVIVTGNMFGDILSDEASQISGSLGMLASAAVGDKVGIYEPIHGSAPDIAGKNIANPLATILSTALMLDIAFGMREEAQTVIDVVDNLLKSGYRTGDIADTETSKEKILGTDQIGEKVLELINNY